MDSDDILTTFREEWRIELENSYQRCNNSSTTNSQSCFHEEASTTENSSEGIIDDIELQASELFKKGAQLEQDGQLYESIWYYRKAISLVPDIERKVHIQNRQEQDDDHTSSEEERSPEDPLFCNLIRRFENMLCDNQPICQPHHSQEASHLSCLPNEMLDRILHWVIGSELDFESLEKVSCVCRGFYIMCRNPDIWRRACTRIWDIKIGELVSPYSSWREMFIWRPRPRFNGCYISKTTYFRSGENSFQDHSLKPWHIVSYYRYFRFFPSGKVLMLTSSEEPQGVLGCLRNPDLVHSQFLQVSYGHFRLHGNSLTLLFQKTTGQKTNNTRYRKRMEHHGSTDVVSTTFNMEMEIKCVRQRPNWQLFWRCYSVVSSYQSGSHTTSVVNVSDQTAFPPLAFSIVKSFTTDSEAPFD